MTPDLSGTVTVVLGTYANNAWVALYRQFRAAHVSRCSLMVLFAQVTQKTVTDEQ